MASVALSVLRTCGASPRCTVMSTFSAGLVLLASLSLKTYMLFILEICIIVTGRWPISNVLLELLWLDVVGKFVSVFSAFKHLAGKLVWRIRRIYWSCFLVFPRNRFIAPSLAIPLSLKHLEVRRDTFSEGIDHSRDCFLWVGYGVACCQSWGNWDEIWDAPRGIFADQSAQVDAHQRKVAVLKQASNDIHTKVRRLTEIHARDRDKTRGQHELFVWVIKFKRWVLFINEQKRLKRLPSILKIFLRLLWLGLRRSITLKRRRPQPLISFFWGRFWSSRFILLWAWLDIGTSCVLHSRSSIPTWVTRWKRVLLSFVP